MAMLNNQMVIFMGWFGIVDWDDIPNMGICNGRCARCYWDNGNTVDGGESLHHQKDGWKPVNSGING